MCGIAGIIGAVEPNSARHVVELMTSSLVHRGPDDHGFHIWNSGTNVVAFGHTRLSILDLSASGHQPMTESQHRCWITFNGEIYNHQELRLLLDPLGRSFCSGSDTETILHAFKQWSVDSFRRLRGMFAFALLDQQTEKVYLVRDSLGIKPLYYYWAGETLLFASEVRALLSSGLVPHRICAESVAPFLQSGGIGREASAVAGVCLLQPKQVLTLDLSKDRIQSSVSSYEPAFPTARDLPDADRSENAAHMLQLLKQSVQSHLLSDVPVGLFLSGGIDSSALLHLMKQVGCDIPRTFTVVFPEQEFSESQFARRIASRYGAAHTELDLSESSVLAQMPDALCAMDAPTMDGVNTFVISRAVRSAGVKVALSGLGADELFAGYPSFTRLRWARRITAVPAPLRRSIAGAGRCISNSQLGKVWDLLASDCTPLDVYDISRQVFSPSEVSQLLDHQPATVGRSTSSVTQTDDCVNEMSRLELDNYMTAILLRDTDFMSMASSLEVRVPFLDKAVVRHSLSMPGRWKLSSCSTPKPLLLESLRGVIPDYVWNRRKMGFVLPFERWMRSSLRPQIEDALLSKSLAQRAGLAPGPVAAVWRRFLEGGLRWSKPWSLFVLLTWCERYDCSV